MQKKQKKLKKHKKGKNTKIGVVRGSLQGAAQL